MPRRTHGKTTPRRSTAAPERSGGTRRRTSSRDTDAEALLLREAGNSYSAIARTLGFERATEAHNSFVRALGTREGDELKKLVKNEQARLDQLEVRIRERDAADLPKLERRLLGVQKLREAIPK